MPTDSRRRKPGHDDDDEKRGSRDARQIVEAIRGLQNTVQCATDQILEALQRPPSNGGTLTVAFTVLQRSSSMPSPPLVMDPQTSLSDHKQPVNAVPTKNGAPDPDVVVSCVSSDASVGVEPNPDGGFFLTTPNDTGSARITVSAPGYRNVEFDFSYAPPVEGELNVFFGEDVPE